MEPDDKGASSSASTGRDSRSNDDDAGNELTSDDGAESLLQSPLTPPHWLHHRRESYASIIDERPPPIVLEDHTEGLLADDDTTWAKAIYIEDYALVSGNLPTVGSFVVWQARIDTVKGGTMVIRKRYSEFLDFRRKLLITFPNSRGAMPPFPPKSMLRESSYDAHEPNLPLQTVSNPNFSRRGV